MSETNETHKEEAILDIEGDPLSPDERAELEEVRNIIANHAREHEELEKARATIEARRQFLAYTFPSCALCGSGNMQYSEDGFTCGPFCHRDLANELKGLLPSLGISQMKERIEKLEALVENMAEVLGEPEGIDMNCVCHIKKMAEIIITIFPGDKPVFVQRITKDTQKIIEEIESVLKKARQVL